MKAQPLTQQLAQTFANLKEAPLQPSPNSETDNSETEYRTCPICGAKLKIALPLGFHFCPLRCNGERR